jgi:DNA-directed RNA polymerase specialized sigma24 family protein
MALLDATELAPVLLHYAQGVPQKEVAAHLDIPVEHLRVRLYRTILKLRRLVRKES